MKLIKIGQKSLIIAVSLLTAFPVAAKYRWDIEKAERSCEIQRNSLFRDKNGTPACTKLKELRQMQREFEINQRHRNYQEDQRMEREQRERAFKNANPRAVRNGNGQGYRWNPNESKYCQHDNSGFPTLCY